jgi:hypothetical protein
MKWERVRDESVYPLPAASDTGSLLSSLVGTPASCRGEGKDTRGCRLKATDVCPIGLLTPGSLLLGGTGLPGVEFGLRTPQCPLEPSFDFTQV